MSELKYKIHIFKQDLLRTKYEVAGIHKELCHNFF